MSIKNIPGKLWSVVTSPKLVVALNVFGLALQIAHTIEQVRGGDYKQRKIGFGNDDAR